MSRVKEFLIQLLKKSLLLYYQTMMVVQYQEVMKRKHWEYLWELQHINLKKSLKELIKIGNEKNCDKIVLSSSEKNSKFYEKIGFQKNELQMVIRN